MRLLPLLLLVLALGACGSEVEETGVPASSGVDSASGEGTASTPPQEPAPVDELDLKPPAVLLVYNGQEQKAVRGSYCVDYLDEASGQASGVCADAAMPTYPVEVTSVAGGDRVTFMLRDAVFKPDSVVVVRPLGCTEDVVDEIPLEPGTGKHSWMVDLEHGAYQLDVFARFKADDGRSGDVSGSFGLTSAGPKKWDALGVGAITDDMPVCEFPA